MNKRITLRYLLLAIMMLLFNLGRAQNLLDMTHWVVGTGSTGVFNQNGSTDENSREWGVGPLGNRVVLWKASPSGDGHDDGDWNSDPMAIDHRQMYRFSVWVKRTNSFTGNTYLGCSAVALLDGTTYGNPYFFAGHLPKLDQWYLIVGFVHGSDDTSVENLGGVYDGLTGQKVMPTADFKFLPSITHTNHRSYLFYDSNTADRQYFYAPRVEVVDGNEPSLEMLLGINRTSVGEKFFADNVGIKTQNTRGNALSVNGHIRAREIKVEAQDWPDYVFEDDYVLPRLEEVEGFVRKNKHLPGVPKATVVEEDGVSLGEMNKILLKKVEELTLHLISMKKEIGSLKEQLSKK